MVSNYNPTPTSTSTPGIIKFSQIARGKVKSVKTGQNTYRITFLQNTDLTLYQTWSKDGGKSNGIKTGFSDNSNRYIFSDTSNEWQKFLFVDNFKEEGFQPTTIMGVNNCLYAFVITNAYFNKCKKLTLDVSTKPIDNLSKTVKTDVKTGVFYARFDIDNAPDNNNGITISYSAVLPAYPNTCGNVTITNISANITAAQFNNNPIAELYGAKKGVSCATRGFNTKGVNIGAKTINISGHTVKWDGQEWKK